MRAKRVANLALLLSLGAVFAAGALWLLAFAASTGAAVLLALAAVLVAGAVFALWFFGHLARDLDPFRVELRRR
jgi:hypothetical protein